ncbi:hypothetical protein C8A01DRAFT_19660 [Parachaetomium inaequale]|uniref:Uncharacterized protein n=1 Tax=Parachaetomium inaequale TaxID=2588326 RepID=A0AAN6P809_9PEZI|nr:hypothetical protein C8A01DRAFT_19660 [Parachaetomium inaequale]
MCTQTYYHYQCGCKQKGEFEQCDRLFDLKVNLQCATADSKDKTVRSYCAKHLLKEGGGGVVYIASKQRDGVPGGKENAAEPRDNSNRM